MIRHHTRRVGPRIDVDMLVFGLPVHQRRAHVHVIELLGVHVVCAKMEVSQLWFLS